MPEIHWGGMPQGNDVVDFTSKKTARPVAAPEAMQELQQQLARNVPGAESWSYESTGSSENSKATPKPQISK